MPVTAGRRAAAATAGKNTRRAAADSLRPAQTTVGRMHSCILVVFFFFCVHLCNCIISFKL